MRVLVFHGYLLRGTGSNVYNARLCAALARAGHSVDLLCQEPRPEELDFVDAVGTWEEGGRAGRRRCASPVRVTVWRPDIGRLLPVYVADRYEGFEARTLLECSDAEIEAYVQANVGAVRDVCARARPDVALANHLVMGPAIVARGLRRRRALRREGPRQRPGVRRQARPGALPAVGAGGPRGGPRRSSSARATRASRCGRRCRTTACPSAPASGRPASTSTSSARASDAAAGVAAPDRARWRASEDAPAARAPSRATRRPPRARCAGSTSPATATSCFIGKLIVSKGIDLLLAAWPLVLARARRASWSSASAASATAARAPARRAGRRRPRRRARASREAGRELEGGPRAPLRHLLAFLETRRRRLLGRRPRDLRERVVLTGRLEHDELAPLLAACEALVFPSTFPEAYGMVAAEAAACGVLPVSRRRTPGAPEVSADAGGGRARRRRAAGCRSRIDDDAVRAIAARVRAWLEAPEDVRARHAGRARGHGARALLVGGRGRRGHRCGAGTAGGAAARGLR